MTSKWINEKAQLEHLILIDKLSYEEIGRRYGCSGANIKNVARRLGIELPIKRKINPKETFNRKYKYCLNCDSQLDTYKSKNKCGERSYYRYHKNEINNNKN